MSIMNTIGNTISNSLSNTISNTFGSTTASPIEPVSKPGIFDEGGFVDRHRFGVGAGIGGLIGIAGYWVGEKLFGSCTEEEYDAALEKLKKRGDL